MALYSDVENTIQSGDLLAWSTKGIKQPIDIICHIVRIFTKSEYDHVGIAWKIGGRLFVIDAVPPTVRIFPLEKKLPFYHIPMNVEWNPKAESLLLSKIGDKYSVWQAFLSYFKKPNEDNQWQCAELVNDFYKSVGINLEDAFTPTAVVSKALEKTQNGMRLVVLK